MLQDLPQAFRLIRRSPGFSATAMLTMAIGIAAATVVFSVLYNVLVRPLPYPDADRLVRVWEENPGAMGSTGAMTGNRWLSGRTFQAWIAHPRTIDLLGSYSSYQYMADVSGEVVGLRVSPISPTLLAGVAGQPLLGRIFTPSEGDEPVAPVAILSERLWHDRFGADATVIGRRFPLDGEPRTVIGVLPEAFQFPDRETQVWVPLAINRTAAAFTAVARLRPAVTLAEAETEGTAAARSVPRPASEAFAFGTGGGPAVVYARPLNADMTVAIRPVLIVLAAGVGLLLLVGCANVANLLLARGVVRQHEIAVRTALGASGARVVRQLMTETVVLAVGGGILGVGVAWMLVRLIPTLAPASFPRVSDIQMNVGVLSFALTATILTALASGLLPAFRGAQLNLFESLRSGTGAGAGGFRGANAARWRSALLAMEAAFAVLLLVGATLLGHSFVRLINVDNGYDAEHVLVAHIQMPRGATAERTRELIVTTLDRMRAMPGVLAAGAGNMMPLLRITALTSFKIPSLAPGGVPTVAQARIYIVTPGYAEALRLRLLTGRLFDTRDLTSSVVPMIVNEEFVRRYLQGTAVIGRRFEHVDGQEDTAEIVGVLVNVLKDGNDKQPQPELYFVASAHRPIPGGANFVIRTAGDPSSIAGLLRTTIRSIDRGVLVDTEEPLTSDLAVSMAEPRFGATVVGLLAGVALILAAVGLYSMLSFAASQRRRELGIRSALGATTQDLIIHVVVEGGLTVTAVGMALGLAGAAALAGFMKAALFGITPYDPVAFVIAPAILLPVAAVACVIPARRAATVDPAEALRAE